MVDLKDIVQLAIGAAGWALAALQYWRNELTKRPLLTLEAERAGDGRVGARLTIRNRGPWDVFAKTLRVIEPDGAELVVYEPRWGSRPAQEKFRGRELKLAVHLDAFGSGEFPSRSFRVWIEKVPSSCEEVVFVMDISLSRATASSKRLTVRHRIQSVNSKSKP
jgi:hypothetical protein